MGSASASVDAPELDITIPGPATKERRPDWVSVCIRRMEVKVLTLMAGDGDGTKACLAWWRKGALFAGLND